MYRPLDRLVKGRECVLGVGLGCCTSYKDGEEEEGETVQKIS